MRIAKIILACALSYGVASADSVVTKSMSMMEEGMTQIQKGFLNNNVDLIKSGSILVKDGNALFSDKKIIKENLPENKKHLTNVASTASERIALDINVLQLNLDDKAYLNAADAYSDMLNACSRCHAIVRSW